MLSWFQLGLFLGYWDTFPCVRAHSSLHTQAISYSPGTPTGVSITCRVIFDLFRNTVAIVRWLPEPFSSIQKGWLSKVSGLNIYQGNAHLRPDGKAHLLWIGLFQGICTSTNEPLSMNTTFLYWKLLQFRWWFLFSFRLLRVFFTIICSSCGCVWWQLLPFVWSGGLCHVVVLSIKMLVTWMFLLVKHQYSMYHSIQWRQTCIHFG